MKMSFLLAISQNKLNPRVEEASDKSKFAGRFWCARHLVEHGFGLNRIKI